MNFVIFQLFLIASFVIFWLIMCFGNLKNRTTQIMGGIFVVLLLMSILVAIFIPKFRFFGVVILILLSPTILYYLIVMKGVHGSISSGDPREMKDAVRLGFTILSGTDPTPKFKKSEKPVIYMTHHFYGGITDNQLMTLIDDNITILAYNVSTLVDKIISLIGGIFVPRGEKGNYEPIKEMIKIEIEKGKNIMVYPEGKNNQNRKSQHEIMEFRSGLFRIAKELGIDIVPVAIKQNHELGFLIIPFKKVEIIVGEPIKTDTLSIEELKSKVKSFFVEKYKS